MTAQLIDGVFVVIARDLDEAWNLSVRGIMDFGYVYDIVRGSHVGSQRRELDSYVLQVLHPGTKPLVPIVPEGTPPPCTMEYVEGYLPYLICGGRQGNEDYTYGEDVEKQLPKFLEILREGGEGTNQACMTIGSADTSLWLESSQCLKVIDARVRDGKLHFHVYFRSWDMWSGFPANLAAVQAFKEYVALELGVPDGVLYAYSKGLHLYKHHWKFANEVLGRV